MEGDPNRRLVGRVKAHDSTLVSHMLLLTVCERFARAILQAMVKLLGKESLHCTCWTVQYKSSFALGLCITFLQVEMWQSTPLGINSIVFHSSKGEKMGCLYIPRLIDSVCVSCHHLMRFSSILGVNPISSYSSTPGCSQSRHSMQLVPLSRAPLASNLAPSSALLSSNALITCLVTLGG